MTDPNPTPRTARTPAAETSGLRSGSLPAVRREDLFWMIIIRVMIITGLAVAAVLIQFSTATFLPLGPFYTLILLSYGVSLLYIILYSFRVRFQIQLYVHIAFDLLLITAFVYISGGLQGTFYFLYIFEIIMVSTVLSSRAAYITAGLSAICFGFLADGLFLGLIPAFQGQSSLEISQGAVLNNIFIAWTSFFLVAWLTNSLTRKIRGVRRELKEAQRELGIQRNLAMAGEISANLAHEIRNPLSAVSGAVQVLKNEMKPDAEQKKLMDIVIRETERVSQTLEQFLNLACSGSTRLEWIDLSDLLQETLYLMRKGGRLNGNCSLEGNYSTVGIKYYGNTYQFKQIFWNLIKNALKAMPEGGTLTIDLNEDRKRNVSITFKDSGRGMGEEEKNNLFKPFFSTFKGGSGIGLSVVRNIVDEYNGVIRVNSGVNQGTEIVISLPIQPEHHQG